MAGRSALFVAVALACISPSGMQSEDKGLFPFVLPWDDSSPGIADLSSWNHKPAGKFGVVTAGKDGHLYAGKERIRFLGTNLCFAASFPRKEDAEKIAARMAKFGVNCVRFHHMDMSPFPNGIRDGRVPNTRALDPEALDRLDYFTSQLKRNGIYLDLNLLVSRPFNAADGLPKEIESLEWKERHIPGFFFRSIIDLQKEYAAKLLSHRNPYTGLTYAEDPAVAFVEINNENGLIHSWLGGDVDHLPIPFLQELRGQWNSWLKERYGEMDKLRSAWNARETPLGDEMLANPAFAGGTASWNLEQHNGAKADVTATKDGPGGAPAVKIAISARGTEGWHIQLNQSPLAVKEGTAYTLTFKAKAEEKRSMRVEIGEAHEPWSVLSASPEVPLTDQWQSFRFTLLASKDDANSRLNFTDLGKREGVVRIADVSLRPGGVVGLLKGEELSKGSFPLFTRANSAERSVEAQRDWIRFLWGTERNYWREMRRYIKEDLKVKALVVGTIVGCSTPNLMAEMDAVDTHAYWRHPHFPNKPWDPHDWFVTNDSMVNAPGGFLADLALRRVEGKPHLVTEYNHAAPNTFSGEAPLLLAAFASLQDWDGVFLFSYSHRRDEWDKRMISNFFDIDQHPLKMANLPIAAAIFRRGDVAPIGKIVTRDLDPSREIDILRSDGGAWNSVHAGYLGIPKEAALLFRLALRCGEKESTAPSRLPNDIATRNRYETNGGEFVWDISRKSKGIVTVNSDKSKVVAGFVDGRTFKLGDVTIAPGATLQDWCAISITSMEDSPITRSSRLLVVACGYVENSGTEWLNKDKSALKSWGKAPSIVEGIPATITLPAAAVSIEAWSLDERGQRRLQIPVTPDDKGNATISIGPRWKTLWYEIARRKE